jgi:hypothetical protein
MTVSVAGKPALNTAIDRRELSAALRAQVFAIKSSDVGSHVPTGVPTSRIYGAMLDTALADEVVSLVALTDGSVSVYVSDGSGCIGCGAHPDVRTAATEFLRVAELTLSTSTLADSHAVPAPDSVRCFLLTNEGVHSSQSPLQVAHRNDSPLGAAYVAGLHLLQVVERAAAGRSLQAEIDAAMYGNANSTTFATGIEPCLSVGNAVRRLRS